ncbi:MAG: penicillin-binding protein 2 [Candidatus Omnitrophica bacterium]|nr:penicillin-binding protein 2 [Candidatus Omnitrophota bacterium]
MDTRFLHRIILVGFFILVATFFCYQIQQGDYYLEKARNNYIKIVPFPSMRGRILDRQGKVLAYDSPIFTIAVVPYQIRQDRDTFFEEVSQITGQERTQIESTYQKNFLNVFSPVDIIEDIPKEKALKIKEKLKGQVTIRALPRRTYAFGYEYSHILGYVKDAKIVYRDLKEYGYSPFERTGVGGIEQYYDSYLKGTDGADLIEVNSKGEMVGFLGKTQKAKGSDLSLTIDSRLQALAYECLEGHRGVLILMNAKNGEMLALVSHPSYNVNDFLEGKHVSAILHDRNKPLINRAIQARYPPGSLFKPLLALAALQEKEITPRTTFFCNGGISYGNVFFGCTKHHGDENIYQALSHSCNVYFYNIGLLLKVEKLAHWAKLFRLDQECFIDLPYEKKGLVPDRRWKRRKKGTSWFGGDTLNFSIGQGFFEITPLRAAVMMNVFASGGEIVFPHIGRLIENTEIPHRSSIPLNVSPENIAIVRQGLRRTVSDPEGTAHLLNELGLKISGKTGTAQTGREESHGWFAGFFPYKGSEYTICVFLEYGKSSAVAVKVAYHFLEQLKEKDLL